MAATVTVSANITVGGTVYEYAKSAGVSRGDYTDPLGRFVHDLVEVRRPDLPDFLVLFRSDRAPGMRHEVIFENGRIHNGPQPLVALNYDVTILLSGSPVYTTTIVKHDGRTRWRWQSAARPVTRSVAELVAANLVPHYDASVARGFTPAPAPVTCIGYGARAGMKAWAISTGERIEIGPFTEHQAQYLVGNQSALSSVMAQAEAGGSYEWLMRDENTGSVFDYVAYPRATMYDNGLGVPQIVKWNSDRDEYPDAAHEPALGYLPFLLTGDSYYLEMMQHTCAWNTVSLPYSARAYFNATYGVRAHAWHLWLQGQLAKVTPATVPTWLKPAAYWKADLDRNLAYMTGLKNNPATLHSLFRGINTGVTGTAGAMYDTVQIQPYQEYFQAWSIGWMVDLGFSEWLPILQWKTGLLLAMTNGTSGWVRARPAPYVMVVQGPRANPAQTNSPRPPMPTTWAAVWALNLQHQPAALTFSSPDLMEVGAKTYASYLRGALVMAVRAGVPDAQASLTWLDQQFQRILTTGQYIDMKWAMVA